jgi:hypothetical protein
VDFTITCEGYFSKSKQTIPVTVKSVDSNVMQGMMFNNTIATEDIHLNGNNCENGKDKICHRWLQYRDAPSRICHKEDVDNNTPVYDICAPDGKGGWPTGTTPHPCPKYCKSNEPWIAYNPGRCACTCYPPLHFD